MLFELLIKDLILIEEVKIPFTNGLNIMTGETGAGKSMVIGALNLILGGTASKEMIRIGSESAYVKASFFTSEIVNQCVLDMGFSVDEEVLMLSRELTLKGKSVARINGDVATVSQLKTVAGLLLDIHGQMDNQFLLNAENQLALLDHFSGPEASILKAELSILYHDMLDMEKELALLEARASERAREMDFISFQLEEIERSALKVGEDETIEKEFDFLNQLENISGHVERALGWLSGEFGESALSTIASLASGLEKVSAYDQSLEDYSTRLKDAFFILEDLSKDLHRYKERIEIDPQKLNEVERRFDEINRLKAKYDKDIESILSFAENLRTTYTKLETLEEAILNGHEALNRKKSHYDEKAQVLSEIRKNKAMVFERALQEQLKALNMKDASFQIAFEKKEKPSSTGYDSTEFMISTNLGMPHRPLRKVVSGGELSRLMLGIKIILGDSEETVTLIFDEIDAGISGVTANVVGEKLSKLASGGQIISITHLPQIAVYGDYNLLIEKKGKGSATITEINPIDSEALVLEIARLVGGIETTEATMSHAKEMLETAATKKRLIRRSS